MISKQKLLEFLNETLDVNRLSQAGKALEHVIKQIESGAFDTEQVETETVREGGNEG